MGKFLITSEAVGAGHPDKICDQIADAILDEYLKLDPNARVACEVIANKSNINIFGEIKSSYFGKIDVKKITYSILKKYGYIEKQFSVFSDLVEQSREINFAVENSSDKIAAGDQGIMFGYATNETNEYMPLVYIMPQEILKLLEKLRCNNQIPWVKSDMKSQITLMYNNKIPQIKEITLSVQHDADFDKHKFYKNILNLAVLPIVHKYKLNNDFALKINEHALFTIGGPIADSGLTGRKIIVDTYGPAAHHGGGSFSGKDYTKVDRTGAYAARWIAKNIVAAKVADKCEIQLAYLFGEPNPISINVNTFHTSKHSDEEIINCIKKIFNLSVANIVKEFNMTKIKYLPLSTFGHFGREEFNYPWERLNMVKSIKKYI